MLMTFTTAGLAEAPPRNVVPVTITPENIQQALRVVTPPIVASYHLNMAYQPREAAYNDAANGNGAHGQIEHHPGGCARSSGSLCFDYRTGHAVYKPMRKLLPDIPGMTPHNLSIRRSRIVAEYTFK
jgi:hypothetical protein